MKKAALALILTVFTSCVPGRMGYHTNTYIIDYSVFTEKGFFVSESNSVSFDYRPIGSLYVTVYSGKVPGVKKLAEKKLIKKSEDDIYPDTYESEDKTWKEATVEDALNEIHRQAVSIGANGIINLKIEQIPETEVLGTYRGAGIGISGMAIQIKKNG